MTATTTKPQSPLARLQAAVKKNEGGSKPLGDLAILVYGEKKSGKSTFAANFPGAVFLDVEGGLRSIECERIGIPNWQTLREATRLIGAAAQEAGYQTPVVDGLADAWEMCRVYVFAQNGWTHEQDGAYGRGGDAVKKEFRSWYTDLRGLPMGFILLAHSQEAELNKATRVLSRTQPQLPKNCWDIVKPPLDFVFYARKEYGKDRIEHVMYTKGTEDREGADCVGYLPEKLPLDYDALVAAYVDGENK